MYIMVQLIIRIMVELVVSTLLPKQLIISQLFVCGIGDL